jgi:hypothetical protein
MQAYRAAQASGALNPPAAPAPAAASTAPAVTPLSAQDAFNNFANSAGMQFQLDQGEKAINGGYAARGQLQSGAAMKALQGFGQHTALNNYFLPYLGLLGGQQATGAQAGSAVAGVGSNFSNTTAGIAGNMGNAIQSGADGASNAALVHSANMANIYNSLGSSLGNIAGSVFAPGTLSRLPHRVACFIMGGGLTPTSTAAGSGGTNGRELGACTPARQSRRKLHQCL